MKLRRMLIAAAAWLAVALVSLSFAPAAAVERTTVAGGGQSTFEADLDGDGDIDGSYFGVAVEVRGGSSEGHFVCAMWGNTDILGLALMAVEGPITEAELNDDGSVTLRGVGTVDLGQGKGELLTNVPFEVTLTEGGPDEGTLRLTVIGAFDGVPGDTIPGNDNYDLPVETLVSGFVEMR